MCNSSLSWKALWKLNGKKIRLHTFRSWKLWPNSTKDKQWDMNDAYFWWQDWHTTVSTSLFKQSYKYPLDIRVLLWNLKSSLLHIISKIPHLGFPTYPKWKRCGEEKKNNLLAISYAQMQFLHQIPLYKLKENPSILDLHATANRLCFLNRWQFSSTAISSAVGLLFKK